MCFVLSGKKYHNNFMPSAGETKTLETMFANCLEEVSFSFVDESGVQTVGHPTPAIGDTAGVAGCHHLGVSVVLPVLRTLEKVNVLVPRPLESRIYTRGGKTRPGRNVFWIS